MTAPDRPPGPEADPIAEVIVRVTAAVKRAETADDDDAFGALSERISVSLRAAPLLAAECQRLRERVAHVEQRLVDADAILDETRRYFDGLCDGPKLRRALKAFAEWREKDRAALKGSGHE